MRVAHLSDLHLNGSFDRRARVIGALSQASMAGARHLIVSGDITAHGRIPEFRELAGILAVNWPAGVTIVPGNHDGCRGEFESVFGPVAPPSDLGDALVIPIDTRAKKRSLLFRALGRVGKQQIQLLDWLTQDVQKPVLFVMHHGSQKHPFQQFEGLIDRVAINRLLARSPLIHVICGHDHRVLDLGQVHAAASCALHPEPLRLYDVGVGGFGVAYRSQYVGTTGLAGPPK
jgi:3',5'-cyclic AMP phosphodiesterase CpdA